MATNMVSPQRTIVENRYPQQQQPQPVPQGNPYNGGMPQQNEYYFDDSDMMTEEQMMRSTGYGDPGSSSDKLKVPDDAFGLGRFATELKNRALYATGGDGGYGDPAHGGVRDRIGAWLGNVAGAAEVAQVAATTSLKEVVDRVNGLLNQVKDNSGRVRSVASQVSGANSRIRRLQQLVSGHGARLMKLEQGETQNEWEKMMLSVAQILPGLRAYNLFSSAKYKAKDTALKAFAAAAQTTLTSDADDVSLSAVTAVTGNTIADINAAIDALEARDDAILEQLNALNTDLRAIVVAFGEAGLEDAIADWETANAPSTVIDLARLLPSQIRNEKAALIEAFAKYVLGEVPDGTSFITIG